MWQKRLLVLLIPGLLATALDRLTKIWAVNTLKEQPMQSYFNDVFRLVYAENTGAFLSLGSDMNDTLRYWVLAVVPVLQTHSPLVTSILNQKELTARKKVIETTMHNIAYERERFK